MARNSPERSWYLRYVEFYCDDCGSDTGCRSRPRTLAERYLLPLFLMRPVRCTECFRRDYRLILVPVKDRLPLPRGKQPSAAVPANRNSNVA